ncbi:DNA-processing protein DprA [Patescibacteria group bacterium]|nr:DNA-processing protein DprA [Patescibacteria group bacterium]
MLLPNDIEYITRDDPRFPPMLLQIADPPAGLYVRGNLKDHPCISVVGTRRLTSYGKRATRDIVQGIVSSGMGIISGMAFGIDAEAHKTALESGGYTIAVLATGIDDETLYPREHVALAKRILESGGAIISEQPPRSPSFKYAFPKRNRLIAGMSPATLVVEASPDSGSLITARLALEENREVLAVPGSIYSSASDGCHELIMLGAKLVRTAEDVLKTLAFDRPELMAESRASLPMTEAECRVYAALDSPAHIDDLGERLGLSAATISATLSLLDMKGYVVHQGGQIWLKKAVFAKSSIK